jgi:hypothetical protein
MQSTPHLRVRGYSFVFFICLGLSECIGQAHNGA